MNDSTTRDRENMMQVAGAVILYKPDEQVIKNILTYGRQLPRLYLIDNSPEPSPGADLSPLTMLENVRYKSMHGNQGIAAALNESLRLARQEGYSHVMTMDQDSQLSGDQLRVYLQTAADVIRKEPSVGAIGIKNSREKEQFQDAPAWQHATELITSGMLIDVAKAQAVGNFIDELFIDFVDFEFCYRLHRHGFSCVKINSACLQHQVGSDPPPPPKRIFRMEIKSHNIHSPLRFYYEYRNSLYVMRHYPEVAGRVLLNRVKMTIKLLLVERNKWNKIRYALRGIYDAVRGRYGKKT